MRDLPDRPVGLLLEPRKPSRLPDERWCLWCHGDLAHEPTCPMVREFVEGLAEFAEEKQ